MESKAQNISNTSKKKFNTKQLSTTSLFAALMCILGPLSIPIGPVPISLTNLVIYFSVIILGTRLGTLSFIVYLFLGSFGLPVFSGYSGGLAKLAGPTGGFLIGFIPMALLSGLFAKKFLNKKVILYIGFVLATLIAYAFGTVWFVLSMKCGVWYALTICVFPFLIGDGIKIFAATIIGSGIRARLLQTGLID